MFHKDFLLSFFLLFLITLFHFVMCCERDNQNQPNIVVLLADDFGSHDMSLRGSNQILTPNIDALGCQGVIFNRHYTAPLCTPSRSAFLSGKYPINNGMQHSVILANEPRSLPLDEEILSQCLQDVGYKTHIVGKWHLGFARKTFTPTYRGFDSHIGNLGPYIDYWAFTQQTSYYPAGFDFRYNMDVYRNRSDEYATDVVTYEATNIIMNHNQSNGPLFLYIPQVATHSGNTNGGLQATPDDLATVTHIQDPDRRTYAAMVKALDRSIGKIITALSDKGILENTFFLFFSDNGAPTAGQLHTKGSNYPLRGQKDSPWEGAVRGVALAWSTDFEERHYVSDNLLHITDWYPTLTKLGGSTCYTDNIIDGIDIWATLSCNNPSTRTEMVNNIDPVDNYVSYQYNEYKYIVGTTWGGSYDTWLGNMPYEDDPQSSNYAQLVMQSDAWLALNPYASTTLTATDVLNIRADTEIVCQGQGVSCNPQQGPCLFRIYEDPCEENNLASDPAYSAIKTTIESRLGSIMSTMVQPNNVHTDRNANPAFHNYIWTWWLDDTSSQSLSNFF
ncbi:arylsulfatase B-like [Lutzomyia longipalpis]|uniref:arylsulfatase B-like n=1 Tax=Lutzomyia longipalpis TaxID=7200 RepID=UPI002483FBAE|nr:arylsulfatase B-like [Lutzomyia longipalpis]